MVLPANGFSCVRRLSEGGGGGWRAQIKDHDLSHSLCNSIILFLPYLMVYYIVYVLFLLFLPGVPA